MSLVIKVETHSLVLLLYFWSPVKFNLIHILEQYSLGELVLKQWGSLYREGQIPNSAKDLHSEFGVYKNYDCVWWFLKSLLEYVKASENGESILKDKINPKERDMTFEEAIFDTIEVILLMTSYRPIYKDLVFLMILPATLN